jgi:hypothetical protein
MLAPQNNSFARTIFGHGIFILFGILLMIHIGCLITYSIYDKIVNSKDLLNTMLACNILYVISFIILLRSIGPNFGISIIGRQIMGYFGGFIIAVASILSISVFGSICDIESNCYYNFSPLYISILVEIHLLGIGAILFTIITTYYVIILSIIFIWMFVTFLITFTIGWLLCPNIPINYCYPSVTNRPNILDLMVCNNPVWYQNVNTFGEWLFKLPFKIITTIMQKYNCYVGIIIDNNPPPDQIVVMPVPEIKPQILTHEQVQKIRKYNEQTICTICTSTFDKKSDLFITNCGHIYHAACIAKWRTYPNGITCPNCKSIL